MKYEALIWRNESMEIVERETFDTPEKAEEWAYDYLENPAVNGQLEMSIVEEGTVK